MRAKKNKKSRRQRNWEFHFGINTWKHRKRTIAGLKCRTGRGDLSRLAARALLVVARGKVGMCSRDPLTNVAFKPKSNGYVVTLESH